MRDDVKKIVEYCEQKLKEEKRIYMIVDNPFSDEFPWAYIFRYIYINLPEEKLPELALVYDSLEKKLKVYKDGEYIDIDNYIETQEISLD